MGPGKMKQHMTHRSKDVDSSRFQPQFFLVISVRYTHSCIISNIRKLPAQIHYVKEKMISPALQPNSKRTTCDWQRLGPAAWISDRVLPTWFPESKNRPHIRAGSWRYHEGRTMWKVVAAIGNQQVCIYVYMYMCIYVYMYICIYVFLCTCICVYMYIRTYVYM